jgi:signal transduction histidine kinase
MAASVRELLEPAMECTEDRTLEQVVDILHQGKPVAIRGPMWRILLPEAVVGHPPSRRAIDLPLRDAPIVSPDVPVVEALLRLRQHHIAYGLALEGSALRGLVSLRRPLERCASAKDKPLAPPLAPTEPLVLLGQLASTVVHEVRNQLGALMLHLDILEEEGQHPTPNFQLQRLESWDYIKTTVTRLQEVGQDYLSLARLAATPLQPADLGAFLRRFAQELPGTLTLRGMALRCEGLESLGQMALHPNPWRRALLNVAKNAVEAMPQGGTLTLRGQGLASRVHIDIVDTGKGIPAEQLSRLFTPWHTTKPEGTSLGLYSAREIIAAHGGTIEAASVPGCGTTFRIALPRSAPSEGTAATDASRPPTEAA